MEESKNNLIFAENLNRYIEISGRTQKEIAEIIGVASSTFNDWCTGRKYPRIGKIELLANYFGCQKSDLIEIKKEPAISDGLSDTKQELLDFVSGLSESEAAVLLASLKSALRKP